MIEDGGPDVPVLEAATPADAFERRIVVCPADLDFLQHVNHARYIDFANDTRVLFERERGEAQGQAGAAVGKLFIEYRREARVGDAIRALCWRADDAATGIELRGEADQAVLTRARIETAAR